MLARLGYAGRWMSAVAHRLRRVAPPAGEQYAVFDLATALWVSVLCVYVLNDPRRSAVNWVTTDGVFLGGIVVVGAGLFAMFASFSPHLIRTALVVTGGAAFVWAGILAVGVIVEFRPSTLGVAVLYGFVARQALRIARGGL